MAGLLDRKPVSQSRVSDAAQMCSNQEVLRDQVLVNGAILGNVSSILGKCVIGQAKIPPGNANKRALIFQKILFFTN